MTIVLERSHIEYLQETCVISSNSAE